MPHPSRHPTPCGAPLRWRATRAGMARTARAPFFSADVYHRIFLITAAVWLFRWLFDTAHTALYVRLLCRVFIVYVPLNHALGVIKPNKTALLLRFTCTKTQNSVPLHQLKQM